MQTEVIRNKTQQKSIPRLTIHTLGLGRGLLSSLIQRPNTTVIAGVRNLSSESTTSLSTLPTGTGSKIITVKIDSTIPSSATDAINELTNTHSISALDVVIANAGISNYYGPAVSTPLAEAREHLEVNVIGTLALFQATWPLLEKAKKPIFVALSTGLASITDMGSMPVQATAYGMSKAALNYMVRKIHFENEALISFVISPG